MIKKSGQWWSTKYIKQFIKLGMKCRTNFMEDYAVKLL